KRRRLALYRKKKTQVSVWFEDNKPLCGRPARPLPGIIKRIIGGRNAEPGFFPWQALIVVEDMSRVPNDKWFGSGALLSDSWVLTAAHVLRSQRRDKTVIPVSKEHVTVYLALHDVRNKMEAVNRTVEKIILHEEFDIQNYNHDIALVKLKEKVTMGNYVMPVCLPQFEHELEGPHPNMLGLVAGWGISNPNITVDEIISSGMRTLSDILQYVKLPVVLHAECKTSYESRSGNYSVTENMFCAGYYEGGKDTCLGDSGGAFVIQDPGTRRWVAQGLVSWGGPEECGSKQVYGVYTKVSNYVDWVEKKTGSSERWTFLEPELETPFLLHQSKWATLTPPCGMGAPQTTQEQGAGFGLSVTITSSHQNFSDPPSPQGLSSPLPRLAPGMVSSHSGPPKESFPTHKTASHLLYLSNTYFQQNNSR
uniref:Peptidase S1 domain-containing protein n=1 Tax=Accipiter nisus TaxID=211598 RepID=A0A8B9MQB8_9AVES